MWTRSEIEKIVEILRRCIDDAEGEVIDAIKINDGKHGSRSDLLAELDVIDKVRERLHVRIDRNLIDGRDL